VKIGTPTAPRPSELGDRDLADGAGRLGLQPAGESGADGESDADGEHGEHGEPSRVTREFATWATGGARFFRSA